ncbi:MAG TPA: tetratricopeptide repeat protein [Burkholderiales bacterium]|nr:tetratricopeptide repeat protein [Burkholderiales bacterium]
MSLINRMLQDLDRRQALETADAGVVRASAARPASREWFWRVLVVLLTAALAWMGWVAIQLLPRKPLATDLAFLAASEARARPPAQPAPRPVVEPAAPAPIAPVAPVVETPPVVAAAPATPSIDALRLATELQTPIAERPPAPPTQPVKAVAAAPAKARAEAPVKPASKPSVDKRERVRSANDNAESHFRRAALLLNHGRVSEAEEQLVAALQVDPRHSAARQAYVSLLLEQQRVSTARRVLQEALVLEPAQPTFALALARIHAAERDYAAALAVLDRAAPAGQGAADFQAFRGAMLQRLGRHDEALLAYQNAVRDGTPPATAWIGYAISLEAVGKRSEAAQAYRRALTVGPLAAEARDYAESRARALE